MLRRQFTAKALTRLEEHARPDPPDPSPRSRSSERRSIKKRFRQKRNHFTTRVQTGGNLVVGHALGCVEDHLALRRSLVCLPMLRLHW
jgi:hypothetical protein